MKSITVPEEVDTLYVCGDTHGDFETLIRNIKRFKIESAAIVIAGDCGFGFESEEHYRNIYHKISRTLSKLKIIILMIRGNHDDPAYFDDRRVNYKRFKCISDYTVVAFKEFNILCIGGGISVDRTRRMVEMERSGEVTYWADENLIYDPNAISQLQNITTLITHSAPSKCFPTSNSNIEKWLLADKELEAELAMERGRLDEILNDLQRANNPIESWYYGHYHASTFEVIDGVRYHLLDVQELQEILSSTYDVRNI